VAGTSDIGQPIASRTGEWDAFISHATEDKSDVVEPLVRELEARGLRIWYDDDVVKAGESLRRAIDQGLLRSRVGIVVLSPHFFGKGWTEAELDALYDRQLAGEVVLIPVWHQLTLADVRIHAPLLAPRKALSTAGGIPALAEELSMTVRQAWLRSRPTSVLSPATRSASGITPERLTELRLAVIDELNELTAEYITKYIENPEEYRPTTEFFQRLLMATDRIRNLFPAAAFDAFKRVEVMIGPNLGPTGEGVVHRFIEARNAALAVLYREAGIPPPP
jgi:hypothetical protein